jgi:hypothetical protein
LPCSSWLPLTPGCAIMSLCLTTGAGWNRFGFVLSYNECNLDCGTDHETLRDFTSITSDFYPELVSHYGQVIEEWYSAHEPMQPGLHYIV